MPRNPEPPVRLSRHGWDGWRAYQVDLPAMKSGPWEVKVLQITDADVAKADAAVDSGELPERARFLPGTYRVLRCGFTTWMADSEIEIREHRPLFEHMRGRVLIFGLGLGMSLRAAALDPRVSEVLVVEKDRDVLSMVAPHWRRAFPEKVRVEEGDALTYVPDRRWDTVWLDIWPSLNAPKNLPEMVEFRRRWLDAESDAWIGCWSEPELLEEVRGYLDRSGDRHRLGAVVADAVKLGLLCEDPYAAVMGECGGVRRG